MKDKNDYLSAGERAEQPKPIDDQAAHEAAVSNQTTKQSVAEISPEMLQQVIAAAILEANCKQKKEQEDSVEQDTQSGQKGAFRGGIKDFWEGLKITFKLIFAPRKYLPQSKADTDTLVHTYTMFLHALATAAWYIAGIVFWLVAAVRALPDMGLMGSMQDAYYTLRSVDLGDVLIICVPMGFVFLAFGGVFRLVSDSLTHSKDMDKNGRIMTLDLAVITAFVTVVTRIFT